MNQQHHQQSANQSRSPAPAPNREILNQDSEVPESLNVVDGANSSQNHHVHHQNDQQHLSSSISPIKVTVSGLPEERVSSRQLSVSRQRERARAGSILQENQQLAQQSSPFLDTNSVRRSGKAMSAYRMSQPQALNSADGEHRAVGAGGQVPRHHIAGENSVRLGLGNDVQDNSEDGNVDDADSSYLGQYSINATEVKKNLRGPRFLGAPFQGMLPFSNNEMQHLNPREAVLGSPTTVHFAEDEIPIGHHHTYAAQPIHAGGTMLHHTGHHAHQAPLYPLYHNPMQNGAFFNNNGRSAHGLHAQQQMEMQSYYERERDDILNLSENDSPPQYNSYRMTSPFNEQRVGVNDGPAQQQLMKTGPTRNDLAYSRSSRQDQLKLAYADSEDERSTAMFGRNQRGGIALRKQQSQSRVNFVQENEKSERKKDGAFNTVASLQSSSQRIQANNDQQDRHRQNDRNREQAAKLSAQVVRQDEDVIGSHQKDAELQQQDYKVYAPDKDTDTVIDAPQSANISPDDDKQGHNSEQNTRNLSADPRLLTSGSALPLINDGERSNSNEQRQREMTGTPQTTKQGTSTLREDTQTEHDRSQKTKELPSGVKTSRQGAGSSSDRQTSNGRRIEQRRAEPQAQAQSMTSGLRTAQAVPIHARFAPEMQSKRSSHRGTMMMQEQQNNSSSDDNESGRNLEDNDEAQNFQQSQQRSLRPSNIGGIRIRRDGSRRQSDQQMLAVSSSEGGSGRRAHVFPLSHGSVAANSGPVAPPDQHKRPTKLETNGSQQSVNLASNLPPQQPIQDGSRRRRQQQNQQSTTMEPVSNSVANQVFVSGGTTNSRKRTKQQHVKQQSQQQHPPQYYPWQQQQFMPPHPAAQPADQHFYNSLPHHAMPHQYGATVPMTPHFYRPSGQHGGLKHHQHAGMHPMYQQQFYQPHPGQAHHYGHAHHGHHPGRHPGQHPGQHPAQHPHHMGHANPHFGQQSRHEEAAEQHPYPYYQHHQMMHQGHHHPPHHSGAPQMYPMQMMHQHYAGHHHPMMQANGGGFGQPHHCQGNCQHGAYGAHQHDQQDSYSVDDSKADDKSESFQPNNDERSCSAVSENTQQLQSRRKKHPDAERQQSSTQRRHGQQRQGHPAGARYHQSGNRRSSQNHGGITGNDFEDDVEKEGSSYPNAAFQSIPCSNTPSERSGSQRYHVNQAVQHMPSQSRRDQKRAEIYTARMNRQLQQQEAQGVHSQHANQHFSSSAKQSGIKRHPREQMQRSATVGGEDEALLERVLPPSLSPAPRSCAEVLTSNHKVDVNMLAVVPQTVQPVFAAKTNASQKIEAKRHQQNLHKQSLKTEREQPAIQENDFRETPGSLFGRKVQEQNQLPVAGTYASATVVEDLIGKSDDDEDNFEMQYNGERLHYIERPNSAMKSMGAPPQQKSDHASHHQKSPGNLLTPHQVSGTGNEEGSGIYERNSLLQSSDNLSGMKLQENPTAQLASSSQHSFQAQEVGENSQIERTLVHDFEEDVKISIALKNQDSSEQASSSAQYLKSSGEDTNNQKHLLAPITNRPLASSTKNQSVIPQLQDMPSSQVAAEFGVGVDQQALNSQASQGLPSGMRKVLSETAIKAASTSTQAKQEPSQQRSDSSQTFTFKKTSSQNDQGNQQKQAQVASSNRFLVPSSQESSHGGSKVESKQSNQKMLPMGPYNTALSDANLRELYSRVKNPGVQAILHDTAKNIIEDNMISPQLPVIPVPQPFSANNSASYKPCNCRRTGCFKLYCDCLRAGLLCSAQCKCQGCRNREPNEQREKLLNLVKAKVDFSSPLKSSQSQFGIGSTTLTPNRGCHCKKSGCLKNYCECFQNGQPCTSRCNCDGCKNTNNSYLIGRSKREPSTPSEESVHSSAAKQRPVYRASRTAMLKDVQAQAYIAQIDSSDQNNGRQLTDAVKSRQENGAQPTKNEASAINSLAPHKRPLVPAATVNKPTALCEGSTGAIKRKQLSETVSFRAKQEKYIQGGGVKEIENIQTSIAIGQQSVQDEHDGNDERGVSTMALAIQDRAQIGLKSPAALPRFEEVDDVEDADLNDSGNKNEMEFLVRPVQAILTPLQTHNPKAQQQKWNLLEPEADAPRRVSTVVSQSTIQARSRVPTAAADQPDANRSRKMSSNNSRENLTKTGLRSTQKKASIQQVVATAASGKILTRAQKCKKTNPGAASTTQ